MAYRRFVSGRVAAVLVAALVMMAASATAATTTRLAWRRMTSTGTFAGPDEVPKPGFVFACDIQLFRFDEQFGIRIEDTVAITATGREVLSAGAPRTVAEIEALMKEDGILQMIRR